MWIFSQRRSSHEKSLKTRWLERGSGSPFLWVGDTWSKHTSQHLFDPYSFTHVLHGVMFYGLVSFVIPQMPFVWQLWIVTGIEALWEIFENTQFIINRYRSVTIELGYEGDSIVNSLSDIGCCVIGFILVQYLGFWWSLTLFVVIEFVLLFWVRDNLTLNILMLVWPLEAIRSWQMMHN
jgi:Protein of unknown function (DUF2585)